DESYRARLRVEVGRLRAVLQTLVDVRATKRGFALSPRRGREVVVLAGPVEEEHAAVLAILADGESWSSSGLALALETSQRTRQRAPAPLAASGATCAAGESWSTSALALALKTSQRTVQRALDSLAAAGKVQSFGGGRARRWMTPPVPGFTTTLLLPGP